MFAAAIAILSAPAFAVDPTIALVANPVAEAGKPLVIYAYAEGDLAEASLTWLVTPPGGQPIDALEQADFEGGDAKNHVIFVKTSQPGKYKFIATAKHNNKTFTSNEMEVLVRPGSAGTPSARGAAPSGSPDFSGALPGSPAAAAPENKNTQDFKTQVRERINALRLPIRDVNFDTRRIEIAGALTAMTNDAALDSVEKFNAEFPQRMRPIWGKDVVGEKVFRLWEQLFYKDAPALANANGVPSKTPDDLRQYYRQIASVLESAELADDVYTTKVAEFLMERGYTAMPSSGAGAARSGGRRCRLRRRG
ncbi:MAG: hypothetical protein HYS13_18210 [Planctomycetia bacterium]|nr:hypothetical protein [Planctomycetia bacterium]